MDKKLDKNTLVELLNYFCVPDAEYWADQDLNDDIWAHFAAFRFLRPLQIHLDGYLERPEEWVNGVLNRRDSGEIGRIMKLMVEAGIPPRDIGIFAYWIAREAYNFVLYRLSDPAGGDYDLENEEELPRWNLVETSLRKDGKYTLDYIFTGRYIPELHTIFPYRNPEGKPRT